MSQRYRFLQHGEIVQKGDQVDACVNPLKDEPRWVDVFYTIGQPAPDPAFLSHRLYRRPVSDERECLAPPATRPGEVE